MNRALLCALGLPTWDWPCLVGLCPECLSLLLSSYRPAQNHLHTQSTQSLLLRKAMFSRLEEAAILSNSYEHMESQTK